MITRFFNSLPIRIIGTNETPFFYASDLAEVLQIVDLRTAMAGFTEVEIVSPTVRARHNLVTYQKQDDAMVADPTIMLLTEPGAYRLIFVSNSPLAYDLFKVMTGRAS